MSMNPESSPLRLPTTRRLSSGRAVSLVVGLAVGLALVLPVRAQRPLADIPSVDRALMRHAPAYQALQDGRVDDATSLLRASVAANPADGMAHQLLCRVLYAQN